MKYLSNNFLREDYLKHYASPYYDPVKAHEYYMRTRELKARTSTSGLNEKGRQAAAYIKNRINEERDAKLSERKSRYDTDRTNIAESKKQSLTNLSDSFKAEKEHNQSEKKTKIEDTTRQIQNEIGKLQSRLHNMSSAQKKMKSAEIKNQIASLRNKSSAARAEITEEYNSIVANLSAKNKSDKNEVNTEYKSKSEGIRNEYSDDKKAIKDEAIEKYASELERLKNLSEFTATNNGEKGSEESNKVESDSNTVFYLPKKYYVKKSK